MKPNNLLLVKTIKESRLSPQKKTAVIKKIDRIYRSKREREKCNFTDKNSLSAAFVWGSTKEGHNYWEEVCEKLDED